MKKYLFIIFVLITGLILLSCKGETGPAGAAGEAGKALNVTIFQQDAYPNSSYQGISDSIIYSGYPDYNYGSCDEHYIMANDTQESRLLIKFSNLDNFIPVNSTIISSKIILCGGNLVTYTAGYLQAFELIKYWEEGDQCGNTKTVSWNKRSSLYDWTNQGGDFNSTPISDAVKVNTYLAYYTLNLNKDVVSKWIKSPGENFGVLIKIVNQDGALVILGSKEYATVEYRPKLFIYYTIP